MILQGKRRKKGDENWPAKSEMRKAKLKVNEIPHDFDGHVKADEERRRKAQERSRP